MTLRLGEAAITIRGNTIINVGRRSIGLSACVNCLIENNVVIHSRPTPAYQTTE